MGASINLNGHYFTPAQAIMNNLSSPVVQKENRIKKGFKKAVELANPMAIVGSLSPDALADAMAYVRQKERTLIGQELHDNVNQILMSAKMFLEMLQPGNHKNIKEKTIRFILMAITEIRKLSKELVVDETESFSLYQKIKELIEDLQLSSPIHFELDYNEETETLCPEKKITLFRIIQEQLKNIITHSKANAVVININICNGKAVLEIKDNGVGFDAGKKVKGIGLSNIYERANSLKGSVELQTAKGCGCTLSVILPAA